MQKSNSMQSKLAKAKGLGSAHDGTHHWWMQRLTAIAILPLAVWFAGSLVALVGADAGLIASWLSRPWNAILMLLFVCVSLYHGVLGMQVVVEDYVHHAGWKFGMLIGMKLLLWLGWTVTAFSILKIALM